MKVLVIDDSELARAQIRKVLTDAGIEVFEQPSAIGATHNILHHHIDAVLVDITMPGLSGDKLVGILRQNPRLQGLLVILVSAKSPQELRAIADHSGADALMPKEQVATELVPLLHELYTRFAGRPQSRRKGVCAK